MINTIIVIINMNKNNNIFDMIIFVSIALNLVSKISSILSIFIKLDFIEVTESILLSLNS